MWRGAEGEGEMTARRIAGYRIGLKKGNNERGGNGQNAPLAARLGITISRHHSDESERRNC